MQITQKISKYCLTTPTLSVLHVKQLLAHLLVTAVHHVQQSISDETTQQHCTPVKQRVQQLLRWATVWPQ